MIVVTGFNMELRREVVDRLRFIMAPLDKSQPMGERTDLNYLTRFVHQDLRYHVLDGLWPEHLSDAERYMLTSAVLPGGCVLVVCHDNPLPEEGGVGVMHPPTKVYGQGIWFPWINIYNRHYLEDSIEWILAHHKAHIRRAVPFKEWAVSGNVEEGVVMLVGEASQEITPGVKRRAFISHKGCSLFLQEALRRNAPTKYYLTNAQATGNASYDRLKLQREIELIKPCKIVALGVEAALVMVDLKVPFTRTWHPQYWARFRSTLMHELCEILKP